MAVSLPAANTECRKSLKLEKAWIIEKNSFELSTLRTSIAKQRHGDDREVIGDASEAALLKYCNILRPVDRTRLDFPKIFEIPFNSTNKWQLSVHSQEDEKEIMVMKGAPEIIIAKCSHYFENGQTQIIDDHFRQRFQKAYERFGGNGERVLGFASMELVLNDHPEITAQGEKFGLPDGLCFVGLISLMDPPRSGVLEAVNTCKNAGIKVVMVTGDHPLTAGAIAKKVGILGDFPTRKELAIHRNIDEDLIEEKDVNAIVVTGHELKTFTMLDWDRVLSKEEIVFARTSPQQKLLIVENLQRLGHIVAVTGDGVNDSPALKKADIGVAMGGKGASDVAREAADVILMDDNFASIVSGIREGRVIFDNLKKTIAYTLSHLWPEILPVLLSLAFSLPLGLASILILCIDLGTELAPAISLSYEKMEADIMDRPPRNAKTDRLVSFRLLSYAYLQAGVVSALACVMAYLWVFWSYDIPASRLWLLGDKYFKKDAPVLNINGKSFDEKMQEKILKEAQTAWFITIVMCQVGHIWMCKTRFISVFQHGISNMVMNYGVIIEIALMVILAYVPFIQPIVGSGNVRAQFWVPSLVAIAILWAWGETRKYYIRKYPKSRFSKMFAW